MKNRSPLFRLMMMLGAPLIIAALCMMRPVYADDVQSTYNRAMAYYHGNGDIAKDLQVAHRLFLKAESLGSIDAQFNLGVMYDNGQGIQKNSPEALKWYEKAANSGHAKAQYNLGAMLYEGYGTSKDVKQGLKWLLKAAEQGEVKAQYKLGCVLLENKGVEQDLPAALHWLQKAADQGHKDASTTLTLALDFPDARKTHEKTHGKAIKTP